MIATCFIALFTLTLWNSTEKMWGEAKAASKIAYRTARTAKSSADISELALIAGERAFVFPIGLCQFWEPIPNSTQYAWRFAVTWQNCGDTPTKHLLSHTNWELRDTVLPDDFDFPDHSDVNGRGMIAPRTTLNSAVVPDPDRHPIMPDDLIATQTEKKLLYMWGWVRYRDVFEKTPEHITKFCWLVTCVGNPLGFVHESTKVSERLIFGYRLNPLGNCADEECEQQQRRRVKGAVFDLFWAVLSCSGSQPQCACGTTARWPACRNQRSMTTLRANQCEAISRAAIFCRNFSGTHRLLVLPSLRWPKRCAIRLA